MKKFFFAVALVMSVLAGSVGAYAQNGAASPENIKRLDDLLASVKPGDKDVRIDDMLVSVQQIRAFRDGLKGGRSARLQAGAGVRYWTEVGGKIPYVFDNLPASEQNAFLEAAREWEKWIGVKFVPRTAEANYIRVWQDPAAVGYSYSALGMRGGSQDMSLQTGATKFLTCHEMGHALGFDHEHQRSDRDKYITVNYANVTPGFEGAYTIFTDSVNLNTYDFNSIMHYFDTAFSVDGVKKTMVCKPGFEQFQSTMGNQTQITEQDKAAAASIYGYPVGITATPAPTPTRPPRPTLVCDPITVPEGSPATADKPATENKLVFRIGLEYEPKQDVSFSYKIARYVPSGMNEEDPNLSQYSATPEEDYRATSIEGTVIMPAATEQNKGNSTRTFQIEIPIVSDSKVENDESLMLILSDPINARFANDAKTLSVRGTISNDDFVPAATATPVPTETPRPTPEPTPAAPPVARVSLSPVAPSLGSVVTANVGLAPSRGTTVSFVWYLKGAVVARDVSSLNLSRFSGLKRGDLVKVEVTPTRAGVVGSTVTAQVEIANAAPVARAATLETLSAVSVSVLLAGSDVDGDSLTFGLATRPANGGASASLVNGKWTLTYRSKVGFIGTDSFSIFAYDGRAKSAAVTIQVKVKANSAPQVVSVSPTGETVTTGASVTFTQVVKDTEKNFSTVALGVGNSSRSASVSGGLGLLYDAATRTVRLSTDNGAELSEPVSIGAVLENNRAQVTLRSASVNNSGTMTLQWQITFKAGWTGTKILWSRVEDTGTLFDGFRSQGNVTIVDSTSSNTKAANGAISAGGS